MAKAVWKRVVLSILTGDESRLLEWQVGEEFAAFLNENDINAGECLLLNRQNSHDSALLYLLVKTSKDLQKAQKREIVREPASKIA